MNDLTPDAEMIAEPVILTTPRDAIVWIEVPVEDIERATAFYNHVLQAGMTIDRETGPDPMATFPTGSPSGVSGHLYPGKPANGTGPTPHFAVPDTLEAAMDRVFDAGGSIVGQPIPLPSGRFCYVIDTEGNSIGLFQPNAA